MAIILNGTTGITTPDIDSTAGFDGEDLTGDVAAARITGALNATGSAPIYACRAWVNFNGTGDVAIRAAGNVSTITDNGPGDYTVNFTTAMVDANYCGVVIPNDATTGTNLVIACENQSRTKTASVFNVWTAYGGNGVNKGLYDVNTVNVSIFS